MYLTVNAATKAEAKRMLAAGKKFGVKGSPFSDRGHENGQFAVEGPWYPKPHAWYATVTVKDGVVTKIK